jgi:hypothetical protein
MVPTLSPLSSISVINLKRCSYRTSSTETGYLFGIRVLSEKPGQARICSHPSRQMGLIS